MFKNIYPDFDMKNIQTFKYLSFKTVTIALHTSGTKFPIVIRDIRLKNSKHL